MCRNTGMGSGEVSWRYLFIVRLKISFIIFIGGTEKVTWTLRPVDRLMNIFLYQLEAGDIDLEKKQM